MAETGGHSQLELPFDFPCKERPLRDIPHYEHPKNDNERLLELQYQFRVNGDRKALVEMYKLGCNVAIKYLQLLSRKYKHMRYWTLEEKKDIAHQGVCYIIQAYLKKKDWAINDSWTGYLYRSCLKYVLPQRKVDAIVEFVDMDDFYKTYEKNLGLDDDKS